MKWLTELFGAAPPAEDDRLVEIAQDAGFALALALDIAGRDKPFRKLLFAEPSDPVVIVDDEKRIGDWVAKKGPASSSYVVVTPATIETSRALKAIAVDARSPSMQLEVVVEFTPTTAPSGFTWRRELLFRMPKGHQVTSSLGEMVRLGMLACDSALDLLEGPARARPGSIGQTAMRAAGNAAGVALGLLTGGATVRALVVADQPRQYASVKDAETWVDRYGKRLPELTVVRITGSDRKLQLSVHARLEGSVAGWADVTLATATDDKGTAAAASSTWKLSCSDGAASREQLVTLFSAGLVGKMPQVATLGESQLAPKAAAPPDAVEARLEAWPAPMQARLQKAVDELKKKEAVLPAPDPAGRFDANQATGAFSMLTRDGREMATARFQVVGSYSTLTNTWFWAWANSSVDAARAAMSTEVRAFGEAQHLAELSSRRVVCTPKEATSLFAFAVEVGGAQGWYRLKLNDTATLYLALYDVKRPK